MLDLSPELLFEHGFRAVLILDDTHHDRHTQPPSFANIPRGWFREPTSHRHRYPIGFSSTSFIMRDVDTAVGPCHSRSMNVTVRIPDELAQRLAADGGDLERRALEAFALAEYQAGRLFESELCQLLDMSRYELDGFLKQRGIFHDYTMADLERDQETLDRLGF